MTPRDMEHRPAPPPEVPLRVLFIHHSCGGHLLAERGPIRGENCVYDTHPLGGGLRGRLEAVGYRVGQAAYGSRIGQDTDFRDWFPKFRHQMADILICRRQDEPLPSGERNQVVVFKSCFPNLRLVAEGAEPGDPVGSERTLANARAAYQALLPLFAEQLDTLFVAVTPPPMAPPDPGRWRNRVKQLLGRPDTDEAVGERARRFTAWLVDPEAGWLADYPHRNVAVFDFYHLLTDRGRTPWSAFPTGDGRDAHPSQAANEAAAAAFVPFLNWAVQRAGGAAASPTQPH